MGVYVCESKRIHVVYDFFDVCLCVNGFKRLHENVTTAETEAAPIEQMPPPPAAAFIIT